MKVGEGPLLSQFHFAKLSRVFLNFLPFGRHEANHVTDIALKTLGDLPDLPLA